MQEGVQLAGSCHQSGLYPRLFTPFLKTNFLQQVDGGVYLFSGLEYGYSLVYLTIPQISSLIISDVNWLGSILYSICFVLLLHWGVATSNAFALWSSVIRTLSNFQLSTSFSKFSVTRIKSTRLLPFAWAVYQCDVGFNNQLLQDWYLVIIFDDDPYLVSRIEVSSNAQSFTSSFHDYLPDGREFRFYVCGWRDIHTCISIFPAKCQ